MTMPKIPKIEGRKSISNLIYLLSSDVLLVNNLTKTLDLLNFQVKSFSVINDLQLSLDEQTPSIILMDIEYKDGKISDADFITRLKVDEESCPQIVFFSEKNDIEIRLATDRLGVRHFFSKPLNINEISQTLSSLSNKENSTPYRILLVDDDEDSLEYHATVLDVAGMTVSTLSNPLETLVVLEEFKPDILLLDVYMPDCSGAELAQIIRQNNDWEMMPIMFLSGESNLSRQLTAMSIDVDDFLVKPVAADNLVLAVSAKAKKARWENVVKNNSEHTKREHRYQLTTMDEHNIVSITDIAGNIISVNDKFCEISGFSRDELLGQNHRIIKSDYHPDVFFNELWSTISTGKVWHGTVCNRKKDGRKYWVESTIVPFLNESGRPYKYVSVRTDISALRKIEERFTFAVEGAGDGVWDWDMLSNDMLFSQMYMKMLGYSENELPNVADTWINSVHPDDLERVQQNLGDYLEGRKDNYTVELRLKCKDSHYKWILCRGTVVNRDENGNPLRMIGIHSDISERVDAVFSLKDSEERNRLLLDSAGDGIYGLDLEGRATFVNPTACKMLGYEEEQLIGQQIHDLIHHSFPDGSDYPVEDCPMYAAFKEGKVKRIENEVLWHKDGSSFAVEYSSMPIFKNNEIIGAVVTFQDIRERIKTQQALLSAKIEAENANQAKSQFLSSMSHELRTPMNAIMGFGQLLKMETDPELTESQEENVDEIVKAANHLLVLINDVLDLAKIEAGQIDLSIEPVSLSEVVAEALQLIFPLAQKRGIEVIITQNDIAIDLDKSLDQPYIVRADRTRLLQVLLNLMSNAVKYNSENGTMVISQNITDNKQTRFSVTDAGEGLSVEQQKLLFTSFNRLGAEQTEIEGTGIGLVITKNIIEKMQGNIGADSEVGKGCTFWFELPNDSLLVGKKLKPDDAKGIKQNFTINHEHEKSVLYIEDNPANLRLVQQIFEHKKNIRMWSAHEPLLGLELAEEHKPDLILLDINLPGMDGFAVLKYLRQREETRDIPVIAISANAMPIDIKSGLDAGFDEYITKPVNVRNLLESVERHLDKKAE